jgi:hypothetical protein
MAYQIKRKSKIQETLELVSGDTTLPINVDIDIDRMGAAISDAQDVLVMAQKLIEQEPHSAKAQEAYGSAIIALFAVVFGKENTEKILAFYDGNYEEMLIDVCPFISDVIMPKVKEASEARKAQLLNAANSMRRGK